MDLLDAMIQNAAPAEPEAETLDDIFADVEDVFGFEEEEVDEPTQEEQASEGLSDEPEASTQDRASTESDTLDASTDSVADTGEAEGTSDTDVGR